MNAPVRCHRCGADLAVIDWDDEMAGAVSDRIVAKHAIDCVPPRPTLTCRHEGCQKPAAVKYLCRTHYKQKWLAERQGQPCAVEGCDRVAEAKGWCKMHHQRWKRHGDPLYVAYDKKASPTPTPLPEVVVTVRKGREPLVCDDCGKPIAATKDLKPALAADARINHAYYCQARIKESA